MNCDEKPTCHALRIADRVITPAYRGSCDALSEHLQENVVVSMGETMILVALVL
jgi:hypothetical protein